MLKRLLVALSLLLPAGAQAAWPERAVTLVVPYAPGGITDVLARVTAERLSNAFGKTFIVENVTGAAGMVATEKVARAAPDGYTLLFVTVTQLAIAPAMYKINYDPVRDFTPVAIVATSPFIISVGADFPANNLKEFIAYVKQRPGELTYGAAGAGSLSHLSAAVFLKRAGLNMTMVPYKGLAPAFNDLLGGSVQMVSATPVELKPFIESKTLKLLATSGATRSGLLPDVPTIAEEFPGHDLQTWNGLVAPANTAPEIVNALAAAVLGQDTPESSARLKSIGVDPMRVAKDDFSKVIARDSASWHKLVSEMGLQQQQ